MRKTAWLFALLLVPAGAAAQGAGVVQPPKWDAGLTIGFFEARPDTLTNGYGDNWYGEGRYAASAGYYWTTHFKTEVEFAHSGEASRYVQEFTRLPNGQTYSYSAQRFHRLQHASVRAVWQFLDNQWVTPYVSAGALLEIDRQRYHVPSQYQFPTAPSGRPGLLRGEFNSDHNTEHRGGVTVGAGTKFYMSPKSYINTGAVWTYAKPATSISFVAGIGIDF